MIQLPNDVIAAGYRETGPFRWEQVFTSPAAGFTGTESEFLAAGLAYCFQELDAYTRRALP
jgi:hypothetical protein